MLNSGIINTWFDKSFNEIEDLTNETTIINGYEISVMIEDSSASTDLEMLITFLNLDTSITVTGFKEISYDRWIANIWFNDWSYS